MSEATWEEPSDLIIEQIEIGPMQNYTYLIGCRSTREVVLVDPAWDIDSLVSHINEKDYTLTAALATHYHPDHVGGSFSGNQVEGYAKLLETNPVKLYAHNLEADGIKKVTEVSESDIARVESGDTLRVGNIEIEFLHTPGHTRQPMLQSKKHAYQWRYSFHQRLRQSGFARLELRRHVPQYVQALQLAGRHPAITRSQLWSRT